MLYSDILHSMVNDAVQTADLADLIESETDSDVVALAEEELPGFEESLFDRSSEIRQLLWSMFTPDSTGEIMIEVVPSENASLNPLAIGTMTQFYLNLATEHGWTSEVLSSKEHNGQAGVLIDGGQPLTHAYIKIRHRDAFRHLFLEAGTHRFIYTDDNKSGTSVSNGNKIHTSFTDVRVYAIPKRTRFLFNERDIDIQTSRSSGAGGQHVNTTDSAVRATHTPSGLNVYVQQERSQHQNREIAIEMLRALVYAQHLETQRTILEQAQDSSVQHESESRYVRTYNLHRDPVETRTILSGQFRFESYNRWETYLNNILVQMKRDLSLFIDALSNDLPRSLNQYGYAEEAQQSYQIQSCKALLTN